MVAVCHSSLPLIENLQTLMAVAASRRQRRALILTGERLANLRLAQQLCGKLAFNDICWFSDRAPKPAQSVQGKAALQFMGRELDTVVFDAWSGFDADAFGALTGCIRAGGVLMLIAPPLREWADYADPEHARITVAPVPAEQVSGRFLQRLVRLMEAEDLVVCEDGKPLRFPLTEDETARHSPETGAHGVCKTEDQQRAVDALMKVASGHRRRPVVLTSDRGRGKSAAFGIAAAQMMQQGRLNIVVTGPRRDAVAAIFEHAERVVAGAGDRLKFFPPDELVLHSVAADVLLVDEAAAIPTPLLEKLLKRYPRIAFATTVHGYEGTGRGFSLRFSRLLDMHSNSWKTHALKTPIRWAADDPLEAFVFRVLALDAEPAGLESFQSFETADAFEFCELDRDGLIDDTQTLYEIFGLLVQAHYRTRPLDLRHLLDGPNIKVFVLRSAGHIAATALVATEGGFDERTAQAIWAGHSRPHGHLLAETLAVHQGLKRAPCLRGGRIMRLTVHPALQRRGLGSRLVNEITARFESLQYDYVGSSFGLSDDLITFWQALDWQVVRVSIQKGASSAAHSAVFLKPLSRAGHGLLDKARRRFHAQFIHQLSDSLCELDCGLIPGLLSGGEACAPVIDEDDVSDLQAFSHHQRLTEVTIGSLWRLGFAELMTGRAVERLDRVELTVLIVRVLQKRGWTACAEAAGLTGRKQALEVLRSAVRKLMA